MPKIRTRVTFKTPQAVALIKAVSNGALTDMGNKALKDASVHVPRDQGTLRSSGISNSSKSAVNGAYILRWDTPYAIYLWNGDVMYGNPANRTYGPEKLKFTDALAREEWAKYAYEVYGAEWKKVYEAALKRRLTE